MAGIVIPAQLPRTSGPHPKKPRYVGPHASILMDCQAALHEVASDSVRGAVIRYHYDLAHRLASLYHPDTSIHPVSVSERAQSYNHAYARFIEALSKQIIKAKGQSKSISKSTSEEKSEHWLSRLAQKGRIQLDIEPAQEDLRIQLELVRHLFSDLQDLQIFWEHVQPGFERLISFQPLCGNKDDVKIAKKLQAHQAKLENFKGYLKRLKSCVRFEDFVDECFASEMLQYASQKDRFREEWRPLIRQRYHHEMLYRTYGAKLKDPWYVSYGSALEPWGVTPDMYPDVRYDGEHQLLYESIERIFMKRRRPDTFKLCNDDEKLAELSEAFVPLTKQIHDCASAWFHETESYNNLYAELLEKLIDVEKLAIDPAKSFIMNRQTFQQLGGEREELLIKYRLAETAHSNLVSLQRLCRMQGFLRIFEDMRDACKRILQSKLPIDKRGPLQEALDRSDKTSTAVSQLIMDVSAYIHQMRDAQLRAHGGPQTSQIPWRDRWNKLVTFPGRQKLAPTRFRTERKTEAMSLCVFLTGVHGPFAPEPFVSPLKYTHLAKPTALRFAPPATPSPAGNHNLPGTVPRVWPGWLSATRPSAEPAASHGREGASGPQQPPSRGRQPDGTPHALPESGPADVKPQPHTHVTAMGEVSGRKRLAIFRPVSATQSLQRISRL